MSRGNENTKYILQLQKNVYGTKQGAVNWYEMLKEGLKKQGFLQSKIDPCLFLKQDALIVTYANDCLIFRKEQKIISELINSLWKDFKLTDKGPDVNAFLGIKVEKDTNVGTLTMTQPALISRILKELSLDE